jgi:hypothetical protein
MSQICDGDQRVFVEDGTEEKTLLAQFDGTFQFKVF